MTDDVTSTFVLPDDDVDQGEATGGDAGRTVLGRIGE